MIFLIFYYIHLWYWYDYKKKRRRKEKVAQFSIILFYLFFSINDMITFHHITLHVSFVSDNFFRYTFR